MAATRKPDRPRAGGASRVAVCVSGEGTNLRALYARQRGGALAGSIALVVADRPCPALAFAADENLATALIDPSIHSGRESWDAALADALRAAEIDVVVLAGFMRMLGPATLSAFEGHILNVHPSLLPVFPGAHAVRDALSAGVRVTGVTVHLVDDTLDGGPIVAQQAVPVLGDDDEESLLARLHAVEYQVLPRAVDLLIAGALTVSGRRVVVDAARAAGALRRRRALISVSDKTGLAAFATRLAGLGFELVSTGGTARTRARRRAGGDRRCRRDRLSRDARWPRQDAPPAHRGGRPGRPAQRRPPRAAGGRGDRAVRAGDREPVPVRRGRRARGRRPR